MMPFAIISSNAPITRAGDRNTVSQPYEVTRCVYDIAFVSKAAPIGVTYIIA